ncbi:MAG: GNAT family N-acetyltransferase [Alphaproteobacteria bacterium]|nr:GNAT family N-acetyltransferase [Alphaproteobacteria bacterium]
MSEKEVKIFPIFNQNDDVLTQFDNIETEVFEFVCNYTRSLGKYIDICKENNVFFGNTFAFGAFDGDDMVGFIRGHRHDENCGYITKLFVLPKYWGHKIGKGLLRVAEDSLSVDTRFVRLRSKISSIKFYNCNGYKLDSRNQMLKCLDGILPISNVIPIFHISETIARHCDYLCTKEISEHVDKFHDPMFVYLKGGNIAGSISATFMENSVMEILRLQVLERRQGIGQQLFNATEQFALHKKSPRIELLYPYKDASEKAFKFYKAMGMQRIGNFTMQKML